MRWFKAWWFSGYEMKVDTELNWTVACLREERVLLTIGDGAEHTASVDMTPEEALDLAHVLANETHGSCADVWLVERQTDPLRLWLTLSSTSRGFVHISRIELDSAMAGDIAIALLNTAATCRPPIPATAHLRKASFKALRSMARWAVQHTRPITRQRQQWMNRVHRAMVAVYRGIAAVDRAPTMRSH